MANSRKSRYKEGRIDALTRVITFCHLRLDRASAGRVWCWGGPGRRRAVVARSQSLRKLPRRRRPAPHHHVPACFPSRALASPPLFARLRGHTLSTRGSQWR